MNYNKLLKKKKLRNRQAREAFAMKAEMELYTAVATSTLDATAYETAEERMKRIGRLVALCDPVFVAQLAVYARTEMHLRSIPLLLVCLLAKMHNGDSLVARTVEKVVERADEITELLCCYQMLNADADSRKKLNRLSRQIQNGLGRAFNRFDEYQFAKYNKEGKEVSLRDALFLVHPKAKDVAQQALFDKIATQTLNVPYTWETELSALGQQEFRSEEEKAVAFAAKWQELIGSGKLGYMALLRNLRNMLTNVAMPGEAIAQVAAHISDPKAIAAARQFPFRYLAAFREVGGNASLAKWGCPVKTVYHADVPLVLEALEKAVLETAGTISGFDENTSVVVAADVSGSMMCPVSRNGSILYYDIALLLSMMLRSRCKTVYGGIFGDIWKLIKLPSTGILAAVNHMYSRNGEVGYSTNGHKVIDWLIKEKKTIDKVMMFTDCQLWNSYGDGRTLQKAWNQYKTFAPKAKLYLFDLCGYGQAPISLEDKDVTLIGGWSNKIFDILTAIENGSDAVAEIKKVAV